MQKKTKYLSDYRKEELSELAEYIAEMYCSNNIVNPELIAVKKGISFSYNNYHNAFDGLIEYSKKGFHIFINTGKSENPYSDRARFTFAHELGHFFIDEHRNALSLGKTPAHSSFTNFASEIYTEWEADYFASSLLIPKERFQKDCFRRKFSFQLLRMLADKYQTSLTSTAIRFADLGNHPILIVFAENNRIKWYWMSKDFPYKYLLYRKDRVPEDTAIGEYFSERKRYEKPQEVWAIDWFNYVQESDSNRKFKEHCVPFKNKALSIIWED